MGKKKGESSPVNCHNNSELGSKQDNHAGCNKEGNKANAVKLHVHWIYFEEIAAPPLSKDSFMVYSLNLVQAWVFGDKILDKDFRNAIVHSIFKRINTKADDNRSWMVSPEAVKYAYEDTMKGASVRRLFVDLYCQSSHEALMPLWEDEDIPFDVVLELAKELAKRTPVPKTLYISNYSRVDHQD